MTLLSSPFLGILSEEVLSAASTLFLLTTQSPCQGPLSDTDISEDVWGALGRGNEAGPALLYPPPQASEGSVASPPATPRPQVGWVPGS